MRIHFRPKRYKDTPLVAEAWLEFEGEGLDGMMLEGFAVWDHPSDKQDTGRLSVTFPSRPYKVGGESRHHWLIHPIDRGDESGTYKLRQLIISAYLKWRERTKECSE